MPLRPVTGGEHGDDRGRSEYLDLDAARPLTLVVISICAPAQQAVAAHDECMLSLIRERHEHAIGETVDVAPVMALGSSNKSLLMENDIHLRRVGNITALPLRPLLRERLRIVAPAFEARPVAGRQ